MRFTFGTICHHRRVADPAGEQKMFSGESVTRLSHNLGRSALSDCPHFENAQVAKKD